MGQKRKAGDQYHAPTRRSERERGIQRHEDRGPAGLPWGPALNAQHPPTPSSLQTSLNKQTGADETTGLEAGQRAQTRYKWKVGKV